MAELGLAEVTSAMKESVALASGSKQTASFSAGAASAISAAIAERGITVVDVIRALHARGFAEEAKNLLSLVRLRLSGDYLQTSALVRGGRVISAVNEPNDYAGPGSGYRLAESRRREQASIRGEIDRREVLRSQAAFRRTEARRALYQSQGRAEKGGPSNEIVVGVSPAFGTELFVALNGAPVSDVLRAVVEGIRDGGAEARIVRMRHTADTSFLGLSAARLSGSGVGIGLQAKGTAVIHRRDRLPHHNLELFSNAPITTLAHYRRLGENAAAYALGREPEPVVVTSNGEALGARFHAEVALIYAIETGLCRSDAPPEALSVAFREVAA
jgi:propanediol dehydratase large subunit